MNLDTGDLLAGFATLVTLILGLLMWRNSRKQTGQGDRKLTVEEQAQADAREDVIARRRADELGRLYPRIAQLELDVETYKTKISDLVDRLEASDDREKLLYTHVRDLRAHITRGEAGPAPVMPDRLIDWFEGFGDTEVVD